MANVSTMVPLVERLIKSSKVSTAIVFADDKIYSTLSKSPMNTRFQAFLENEINSLPTKNENIIIFNFPGKSPAETLKDRGWEFLYREGDSKEKNINVAKAVYLGPPDEDEVRNYLFSLHLKKKLSIDSISFPRIINQLTSWIKRKDFGLSALSHFRKRIPLNMNEVGIVTGENLEISAQEQLDNLVGMDNVREYISKKKKSFDMKKKTLPKTQTESDEIQRLIPPLPEEWIRHLKLHLALTGNPGTGKSTVARLLGELYRESGILSLGHTVKVTRADLVSGYVGQSAPKTRRVIYQALGGVLFIDEAYDLCRGQDDQYGLEAVATLVEAMTDHNGSFMVVIAGYPKDINAFLETNEGLSSRFSERLQLKDYSPGELEKILRKHVSQITDIPFNQEMEEGLPGLCKAIYGNRNEKFGNARDMESLADKLNESAVYAGADKIRPCHLPIDHKELFDQPEITDAGILGKLDMMIGLNGVKRSIKTVFDRQNAAQIRKGANSVVMPGHFLFVGNPGTGKTTVAKLMAEQFFSLGIVQSRKLQQTTAGNLMQGYVGQTSEATREFLNQGLEKVIFIDEAHQLYKEGEGNASYGQDVIDVLVPFSENHRKDCIIILAGYEKEMALMISQSDAGLKDRFRNRVMFEDYSPRDMVEIFDLFLKEEKISWEALTCSEFMEAYFRNLKSEAGQSFNNARAVRNTVEECLDRHASRLAAISDINKPDYAILTEEDLPEIE